MKTKTIPKLLSAAARALIAASPVGLAACGKKEPVKAKAQAPRAIRVSTVQYHPMSGGVTASGVLVPREEAAVSSELPGYEVSKVYVDVQAWVKKGQPLVQLEAA